MDIFVPGLLKEKIMKQRRRTPLFMPTQRRAQPVAYDSPRAAFVAKCVAPSAGARCSALRVATHRHGARPADDDNSGMVPMRSGERYGDIVQDQHPAAGYDFAQNRFFVVDSTSESETRRIELDRV